MCVCSYMHKHVCAYKMGNLKILKYFFHVNLVAALRWGSQEPRCETEVHEWGAVRNHPRTHTQSLTGLGLGGGRSGAARHLNRGFCQPQGGLCHPKDPSELSQTALAFVLRLDSPLCVWTSPSEGA